MWYKQVRESFEAVKPVSSLTSNRDVLLTGRGKELYVHLVDDPGTYGVHLAPIGLCPISSVLLNTGEAVEYFVDLVPSNHVRRSLYLRLSGLPANDLVNTVMVVKVTFDVEVASFSKAEATAGSVDIRER